MTTPEALETLLWLVALGYVAYLVWFLARMVREHRTRQSTGTTDSRQPTTEDGYKTMGTELPTRVRATHP